MKVIHINAHTFDIFYNIGWENWARFKITRDKKLIQTNGMAVPKNIQIFLEKRYQK